MLIRNRRRRLALLLAAAMLLGNRPAAQAAGENVYIYSVEDLLRVAEQCALDSWSKGRTVTLAADLDLKGENFVPFPIFCGVFDGQGHTISGLCVAESGSSMGLFRILQEDAVVRDLTVAGTVSPSGSASQVGGLVGVNRGSVQNCVFQGTVQGGSQVGGIAGMNRESGEISGCTVEGQITGSSASGGIAGQNEGSLVKCTNSAEVNTGVPDDSPRLPDVPLEQTAEGVERTDTLFSSHSDTGGIAGLSRGVVQSCVNNGMVGYPHVGYNVGGVAGRQSGYLSGCVNNAAVYGRKDVGGIVGQAEPDIAILSGTETLEQLENELDSLENLIARSLDSAEAQGSRISGTLSALGDYAGNAKDHANTLLEQTSAFVDGNIQQVNTIAAAVTDALDRFSPALDSLTDAADWMDDACSRLEEAVEAMEDAGSITRDAAALARQSLERLEQMTGELAGAADGMRSALRRLQDAVVHRDHEEARRALASLAEAVARFSGGVSGASDALAALADAIHSGVFDRDALQQLTASLSAIGGAARQFAESIRSLAQNTDFSWDALEDGITGAGGALEGVHNAVRTFAAAIAALREAGDTAADAAGPLEAVRNALLGALDAGGGMSRSLAQAFEGMESAVDMLRRNGNVPFTALGDAFHDASSGLYSAASGLEKELENLRRDMDGARDGLTGNLQAINRQSGVAASLMLDAITGLQSGTGSIISDSSSEDVDAVRKGKIAQCVNNGPVEGDRNVGGTAGAMAIEYDFDPEDDVQRLSLGTTYETRAVLQNNISQGEITGKKDCVGGTVGRMDLGAAAGCQSYGSVTSSSGSYVGGIAGWSESVIRDSFAKCVLSGQDDVGGIAGWAVRLENCRAIATIAEGRSRLGAIAGNADLEGGGITGNRFMDTGTAGVDGVSYAGMAEPVAFTVLQEEAGVPAAFTTFTLTLLADGEAVDRIPFQYGQDLLGITLPEVPEQEGCYGRWPEFDTSGLVSDVTVEAVYTPWAALVASAETAEENGPSLALAEGQFTPDARLLVQTVSQTPPSGSGQVWELTLTGSGLPKDAQVPIRLLDRSGSGTVWQYVSGHWRQLDAEANGQYLLLHMDGLSGVFCVVPGESSRNTLLAVSAASALLLLAGLGRRRWKKKKARSSASAAAQSGQ